MLNLYRRVLLEMRRGRDEFEAAREKFQTARLEFTNTLNVWSSQELLRDRDYNEKLARHCETLQKLGSQHVKKALEETRKSMSEMVWPLPLSDENSPNSQFESESESESEPSTLGVLIGSKLHAQEFVDKSQRLLNKQLLELKGQFVSTIRKLADQANKDRIESLRKAISAFRNDVESELRNEILVELESLAVDIRTLAFQNVRRSVKKERIR